MTHLFIDRRSSTSKDERLEPRTMDEFKMLKLLFTIGIVFASTPQRYLRSDGVLLKCYRWLWALFLTAMIPLHIFQEFIFNENKDLYQLLEMQATIVEDAINMYFIIVWEFARSDNGTTWLRSCETAQN
jgi:hypothetical protein